MNADILVLPHPNHNAVAIAQALEKQTGRTARIIAPNLVRLRDETNIVQMRELRARAERIRARHFDDDDPTPPAAA